MTGLDPTLLLLAATTLAALGMAGLGTLVPGRGREPAGDLAVGWGLYCAAMLLAQRLGLPLSTAALPLLGVGVLLFAVDRLRRPPPAEARLAWLLLLPLLALGAAVPIVAWDDFSHWLPNARFLIEQDAFPHPSLPAPPSQHGVYPPAVALVTHAVGLIGAPIGLERVPERAAQLFTLLLFGALAALLAKELRGRVGIAAAAAFAVLGLFWVNPAFVPRIVFTNYGDAPTAALLGTALLLLLRTSRPDAGAASGVQAALVMAALVNVKQSGLVLAAIGFAAAGALLLAERRPGMPRRLGLLVLAGLPALLMWWLWRPHAAGATGGFSARPPSAWAWHLAPETLTSMAQVALSKVAFVAVLALALAAAAPALRRAPATSLSSAAVPVALATPAWAATLFLSYLGTSFSEHEIREAASFWRYMTQLGGAAGLLPVLALAEARRALDAGSRSLARLPAALGRVLPLLLVAALPLLALPHIWPKRSEVAPPMRRIAAELAPLVTGGPPVAVVDPRGQGHGHVVLAHAWHGVARTRQFPPENRPGALEEAPLRRALDEAGVIHAVLLSTDAGVRAAFDTDDVPPRGWRLMRRDGGGWRTLREGSL